MIRDLLNLAGFVLPNAEDVVPSSGSPGSASARSASVLSPVAHERAAGDYGKEQSPSTTSCSVSWSAYSAPKVFLCTSSHVSAPEKHGWFYHSRLRNLHGAWRISFKLLTGTHKATASFAQASLPLFPFLAPVL